MRNKLVNYQIKKINLVKLDLEAYSREAKKE